MSRPLWVRYCLVVIAALAVLTPGLGLLAPNTSYAAVSCTNLVLNSDMEDSTGWLFGFSPVPGTYSTTRAASPVRSIRLGIVSGSNTNSFSSVRQQVFVPNGLNLTLRARVYLLNQPFDSNDLQEIRILDAAGSATLKQVWSTVSNAGAWQNLEFDLSEFMGQTITLYINVFNDGAGGITAMYVDDVGLRFCVDDGPIPTPTDTPPFVTATPTDTPAVVTATPTSIIVTNTPTPTPTSGFITATPTAVIVTNTPTPTLTPGFVTATPTPIVVTNTPTSTPFVVTNTPTSGPGIITATPTPIVVTNTPTLGPAFVTATPTLIVIINTPTPTTVFIPPSPIPTFTPVPLPPGGTCKECLVNTGFENWKAWYFGKTVLRGGYSGAQAFTGVRSVALGRVNASQPNYNSYSSVRQRAALPRGPWRTATLTFHHFTTSDLEFGDYQELVILDANTGRTLEVPWRVNRNDQTWLTEKIDLTRYLGRSIIVYFNVFNQGGSGSAGMFLDDVTLSICTGEGGDSLSSAIPIPQPPVDFIVIASESDDLGDSETDSTLIITGTVAPDESDVVDDFFAAEELATIETSDVFTSVLETPTITIPPTTDIAATVAASLTLTPGPDDNGRVSGSSSTEDLPFWRRILQPTVCLAVIILAVVLFVIIRFLIGLQQRNSSPD